MLIFFGGVNQITTVSCWWFQTLWKICSSKRESSPNRGENKNIWNHHLAFNGCFNWIVPNLYIRNRWTSPFPSINKWLFRVPGFGYWNQHCWWKKSCTSWYDKYPIICRVYSRFWLLLLSIFMKFQWNRQGIAGPRLPRWPNRQVRPGRWLLALFTVSVGVSIPREHC